MGLGSHPRHRALTRKTSLRIIECSPSMPPCLLHFGCFWTHGPINYPLGSITSGSLCRCRRVPLLLSAFPGETKNGWENRTGFGDIPSVLQFNIVPFKGLSNGTPKIYVAINKWKHSFPENKIYLKIAISGFRRPRMPTIWFTNLVPK
jgi:hypothetical protein